MPSKTFNNLDKDKKIRIMRAATQEFSNYTLREASINRIIKEAGISRGSFYLYFKDIDDIYSYVKGVFVKKIKDAFLTYLKNNEGNLHDSFLDIYDYIIESSTTKANSGFCINLFKNISLYSIELDKDLVKEEYMKKVIELVDKSELNYSLEEEITRIVEMYLHVTMMSVVSTVVMGENADVEKSKLQFNLNILRKGMIE